MASHNRVLENHEFASNLFENLVENQGYRVLAIESSWRIQDLFEKFDESGELDFDGPDYSMFANAFNSMQLQQLFYFAHEFNKAHPEDRVTITGLHPESPVSDLGELEEFFPKFSPLFEKISVTGQYH
jgi:erythromycin esterase-like protein